MRYIESINQSLHNIMGINEKVIIVGEDILDPYGGAFKATKGLSTKFPERVITTPISEASILGFCTGLSLSGYIPILEIMFGDFITLCTDQIINGVSKFKYMYGKNFNVPMVVRTPMGGRRGYGPTHSQTLESLFLGTPGVKIIAPSNLHNPGELLNSVVLVESSLVLFIENKMLYSEFINTGSEKNSTYINLYLDEVSIVNKYYPTIYAKIDQNYEPDVTVIGYGGMTPIILDAMERIFIDEEIIVEFLIPSLIKPIPVADLLPSVSKTNKIVICEEGVKTSGWGAELSCQIHESLNCSTGVFIERIGSLECPIPASKPLENLVLPQVDDVIRAIKKVMSHN